MSLDKAYIDLYQQGFHQFWLSVYCFCDIFNPLLKDVGAWTRANFIRVDFLEGILETPIEKCRLDVSEHTLTLVSTLPEPTPFDWKAWGEEEFRVITSRNKNDDKTDSHIEADVTIAQLLAVSQPDFIDLVVQYRNLDVWYS